MSSFNNFIQLELPKRPFTQEDGTEGQILVRSSNAERPRELAWKDIGQVLDTYTRIELDDSFARIDHAHSWAEIENKPTEFTPEAHTHIESEITDLDKYTKAEADASFAYIGHDHDTRYPVLDGESKIPSHYIPIEFKESKVVLTITERDSLTDLYEGLRVHVVDASDDSTVNSGGAGYIYHDSAWIKIYEEESLDVIVDWVDVINKPELYTKSEANLLLDGKSNVGHDHTESEITDLDKYTKAEADASFAYIGHAHSWAEIENKPELYTEENASIAISEAIQPIEDRILGNEYVVKLGPGSTLVDKINHPDSVFPEGWTAAPANDPITDGDSGSAENTLVIIHNTNRMASQVIIMEKRTGGIASNRGIVELPNSEVIKWKSNLAGTHVIFPNLMMHTHHSYENYYHIKLLPLM